MKPPKLILAIISLIAFLGILGIILRFTNNFKILDEIADFSLIITLVVIIFYVYYTFMIAKDTWRSSASFSVITLPVINGNDPFIIHYFIKNNCKNSLECWCNINATVYGKPISLSGYYSAEHPWCIQPFGEVRGNIKIEDILKKANLNIETMIRNSKPSNKKNQLYLKIEFWYKSMDKLLKINEHDITKNPMQPHYYDFTNRTLVLDV